LVAAALARLGPVLKTSGNRNTEYTAPLLWAELTSEHRVAVVEMAMRGFGQIAHLAAFSRPTLGLVTNIGHSHLELVGSREGIAKAKSELLEALGDGGLALLPRDDDFYGFLCQRSPRVRTFGYSDGCDCQILSYRQFGWSKSGIGGLLDEEAWSVVLPTIGRHLGLNAAAAILAAHECGVPLAEAATDMESAQLPPMRMEIRERDGVTILLDAYNAAPASMAAAIQVLSEEPVAGRRRAVIGEMRELGPYSESAHRDLALWLMDAGIEDVILIGEATRHTLEQASDKGFHRAANLDDIRAFLADSREGDVVLIKGSRAFELEKALE
jgi:UDP-N-acetylmuramoyl-tripeptide--D-alanyl-D-alanine ligase